MSIEREENNGILEKESGQPMAKGIAITCFDDCSVCKSLSGLTGRCAFFEGITEQANTNPAAQIFYNETTPSPSLHKMLYDDILQVLEHYREALVSGKVEADAEFVIRHCEAVIADCAGYKSRHEWKHLQRIG